MSRGVAPVFLEARVGSPRTVRSAAAAAEEAIDRVGGDD